MKRRSSGGQRKRESTQEAALKILRYLEQNPNAADTIEGILEWWLPRQSIYDEEKVVEQALDRLVKQNLIVTTLSSDAHKHYRLNTDCIEQIRRLIREADDS